MKVEMGLEITREQLKRGLSKINLALPTETLNPLTEHVLFEVKDKVLTLKSTNSQIGVIWSTATTATDNFSFTMHGKTLCGLVNSLDGDVICFDYNHETKTVTMSCGKYTLESVSAAVQNFPKIETIKNLKEIKLPQNFTAMLKSVYFSISGDVTKPDLNSLCVDINKDSSGKINLVSTDRIRLSYTSSKIEYDKSLRFIIPKNSILELMKFDATTLMCADEPERIYFKNETEREKCILISVLTNYAYPDIYAYLNNDFKEKESITIKRNELVNVLKRMRLITEKTTKIGTFELKGNKAVISSLATSNKAKEEISLECENAKETFNINLDFILEYLNQETEDKVSFKLVTGKCIVFDKENYRHVLSIAL